MELSFLYHGFGIDRSYHYNATEYKDKSIILKLKSIASEKVTCPNCGSTDVIRYGVIQRTIHNLPIGSNRTHLNLTVQRYQCKSCGKVHQADIPFTHGNVSYTYRFGRYILDLLRMGTTITDVAKHLGVGWDMVKDIHKHYLRSKYSHPDISKVSRIAGEQLRCWCERAVENELPAMVKVANTLLAKQTGILAWYDCKVTNAILEGTNNKVKVINRK